MYKWYMEMGRENRGLRTKPWEAAILNSGSKETIKREKAMEGEREQQRGILKIKKRQCLKPRMVIWLRQKAEN